MPGKYILMWLEAPMQSWGADSKFDRRDTAEFPTRSGILGLICSAMGAQGAQEDFLKDMADYSQTAISYSGNDKPDLRDYHMVGSGYNKHDKWEKLMIPKKTDGGTPVGSGTKQTYRYYLQDVSFAVLLETPKKYEQSIVSALEQPVFSIYLGRKTCIPTDFVFKGIFETEDSAEAEALKIAQQKKLTPRFKFINSVNNDDDIFAINDIPSSFGENKTYNGRFVTKIRIGNG